jgi:hypothetical protein
VPTPAFYDSPDPRIHYENPNLFWDIGLIEESNIMADKPLIKLELRSLSEQELVDLITLVATNAAKAENASIVAGAPYTPEELEDLKTELVNKRAAQTAGKAAAKLSTTQKNTAVDNAEAGLTSMKKFMESKPNVTEAMCEAIGFAVQEAGGPPAIVAPEEFSLTFGDSAGEVDAQWNPPHGAVTFIVQFRLANTPGAAWTTGYTGTRSSCTVSGLTPGALYEFQVCAIYRGQQTPGPACAVVEQRAA